MDKKIYVSIPCLHIDEELENTITSCFLNAENPELINIGIAFIGNYEFYEKFNSKFSHSKNIKTKFYELDGNLGVAKGRILAASMYEEEDYYLQVDSHMLFDKYWDYFLIEKMKKAKKEFKKDKIILTAYAGAYKYVDIGNKNYSVQIIKNQFGYTYWIKNEFFVEERSIPKWSHDWANADDNFLPMAKISAHMMFADGDLAKNLHIPENLIFWEEEIIQSIELINDGYTLVFPGIECFIYHLYHDQITNVKGYRTSNAPLYDEAGLGWQNIVKKIELNFLEYLKNNPEKVKKYEHYIGFDLLKGTTENRNIPKYFINLK
jgi:hypothetical protein